MEGSSGQWIAHQISGIFVLIVMSNPPVAGMLFGLQSGFEISFPFHEQYFNA